MTFQRLGLLLMVVAAPLLAQPNGVNSFNRDSLAANLNWTTANLLDPLEGYPEAAEFIQ